MFRINTSARLILVTDAVHQLPWRHSSLFVTRHSHQLRLFTQTRFNLLKNQAAPLPTIKNDRYTSSKDTQSYHNDYLEASQASIPEKCALERKKPSSQRELGKMPRWTDEEDETLYRLIQEGVPTNDIYASHFQNRTYQAFLQRVQLAHTVAHIRKELAEGVAPSKGIEEQILVDAIKGAESGVPLRTIYSRMKHWRTKERNAIKGDTIIRYPQMAKSSSLIHRDWTSEEDALLRRLLKKYSNIPEADLWNYVAGGSIDGLFLFRTVQACQRRWKILNPPPSLNSGTWLLEEECRLQEAISERLNGEYRVAIDVLSDNLPEQIRKEIQEKFEKRYSNLSQLPSQSSLPILKHGSWRLADLNWAAISEKVGSRDEFECRRHFYYVYNNGKKGHLSAEEVTRLKEGVELFGRDCWKIAAHVGTRSSFQINDLLYRRNWFGMMPNDSEKNNDLEEPKNEKQQETDSNV